MTLHSSNMHPSFHSSPGIVFTDLITLQNCECYTCSNLYKQFSSCSVRSSFFSAKWTWYQLMEQLACWSYQLYLSVRIQELLENCWLAMINAVIIYVTIGRLRYLQRPSSWKLLCALSLCHRPSVCLSVTFVRSTQAIEIFGNISMFTFAISSPDEFLVTLSYYMYIISKSQPPPTNRCIIKWFFVFYY